MKNHVLDHEFPMLVGAECNDGMIKGGVIILGRDS